MEKEIKYCAECGITLQHEEEFEDSKCLQCQNIGKNVCDVCGLVEDTTDLIWFSEDFEPKKGEVVDWEKIKKDDIQAVCENCYKDLLIKK